MRRSLIAAATLISLVPAVTGTALRIEDAGSPDPRAHTRGHDAVWLGHAWVDGRRTAADVTTLAERVRGTGVHDLYVHDGPLDGDGSLDPARSSKAAWAVRALRAAMPGVRVQAWLGQQVGHAKGDLNVDDPATRTHEETSSPSPPTTSRRCRGSPPPAT